MALILNKGQTEKYREWAVSVEASKQGLIETQIEM